MGLGNPIISFRGELDNMFFVESIHQMFPFLSRSQIINMVITWCRLYSAAHKIDLGADMAQRVLRINLYPSVYKAAPRKAAMSQKRGVA